MLMGDVASALASFDWYENPFPAMVETRTNI
jgi:hypothetical protein